MGAAVQLLTGDEHEAIALAGQLANKLKAIIGEGPQADNDWAEIVPVVHQIQGWVMSQAAARAYPDRYRLKGRML